MKPIKDDIDMTTQYKVKQELATFIEQLHKNFGEDAVLKPVEIVKFAERLDAGRRVWLSFLSLGTKKARALYSLPRLIDVHVLPTKAKAKAKAAPKVIGVSVKKRSFGPVNATGRNKVKMIDGHKIMSTKNVLKRLAARNDLPKEMVEQDDETVYRRTTTKRDDDYAVADVIRDHDGGRISFSSSE